MSIHLRQLFSRSRRRQRRLIPDIYSELSSYRCCHLLSEAQALGSKTGMVTETAGALLFDASGRVLLGLRAAHKTIAPNCWDIIGGHVEYGETVEDALVREIGEELGVVPSKYLLLGSFSELGDHDLPKAVHHVFAVLGWEGGSPRNISDEHVDLRWFTKDETVRLANKTPFDFQELFKILDRRQRGDM